ncbi:hypothetical protein HXZ62_14800 [Empedobacter falsenii]|nr:hypothetical protein [Empedobacter falsenii]
MINFNQIVFSIAVIGMSLISGKMNGQILGGMRLKDNDEGPKGQFSLYGSFDYSKVTSPSGRSSNVSSAPIGIGYFFNNNDAIGVNYAYTEDNVNHQVVSKQNETGIWYSPSLALGKYFTLIAHFDVHYVWGQQLSETTASMENFNGFRLRGYPMIGIVLGGGWGLKFRFADFSLLETKSKEGWTKTSVAGVNGSAFGMGVSKNIDFRRKN